MKKKVRSAAAQKKLMEKERAERMNRVAAELEERNDLSDGCFIRKTLEFPLRRSDGTLSGVSAKHKSRSIFQKK